MSQEKNLNKIYNAGKFFEPEEIPEQKPTPTENKSPVKRKISVLPAFMEQPQEDPIHEKVEAVLKGVEPAVAPAMAGEEEEKSIPDDVEVIIGKRQNRIGKNLVAGKSIRVSRDAGDWIGDLMSGGEIYVEGNVGDYVGFFMSGGEIYVEGSAEDWVGRSMHGGFLLINGDIHSFDKTAFVPENKGTIIWKEETIWQNGQKVEPGWTNLNVEEKIEK